MSEMTTKEMWQGLAGCGCFTIVIAFFFPSSLLIMIPAFIIYLIVAIIRSPFVVFRNMKRKAEDKIIIEKFEAALLADSDHLPKIVKNVKVKARAKRKKKINHLSVSAPSLLKDEIDKLLDSVENRDFSLLDQFVANMNRKDAQTKEVFKKLFKMAQEKDSCAYFLALYFMKINNYYSAGEWLGKAVSMDNENAASILANLQTQFENAELSEEQKQQLKTIIETAHKQQTL